MDCLKMFWKLNNGGMDITNSMQYAHGGARIKISKLLRGIDCIAEGDEVSRDDSQFKRNNKIEETYMNLITNK